MEDLLNSGSIQFYFENFISIQASRCSWGNWSVIRIEQSSPGLLSSAHFLPPCFDSWACGETQRYENNPTFPHSIEVMIYNRAQHLLDSRAPRNSPTFTGLIFGVASLIIIFRVKLGIRIRMFWTCLACRYRSLRLLHSLQCRLWLSTGTDAVCRPKPCSVAALGYGCRVLLLWDVWLMSDHFMSPHQVLSESHTHTHTLSYSCVQWRRLHRCSFCNVLLWHHQSSRKLSFRARAPSHEAAEGRLIRRGS